MSKKVEIVVQSFQGSIVPGGELIPRVYKGDIIMVKDDTWEDMKKFMPHFFKLIEEKERKEETSELERKGCFIENAEFDPTAQKEEGPSSINPPLLKRPLPKVARREGREG